MQNTLDTQVYILQDGNFITKMAKSYQNKGLKLYKKKDEKIEKQ